MENPNITPEEQIFQDLVDIVGADVEKLASARGEELNLQESLSQDVTDIFPGLTKVASLSTMSVQQIMDDPNFNNGVNHELQKCAEEWVPLARQVFGLE